MSRQNLSPLVVGVFLCGSYPGSPWENGYCESFNGKLREECLNGEIFCSLKKARIVIEQWRQQYNRVRPPAAASNGNVNMSHITWYKISALSYYSQGHITQKSLVLFLV